MSHLLIVDGDQKSRGTLANALKSRGQRVTAIGDANSLSAAMAIHCPDVVVLSLEHEPQDNLEACERLRSWSAVPLIVLSENADEPLKVQALDSGADDYLVRPFGLNELLARIRAIQRRLIARPTRPSPLVAVGNLTVDLANRVVLIAEREIHLTRKEYALLRALAIAQGRLVTYETLLAEVWGRTDMNERACVRTLVKQLRRKLGDDLTNPGYLLTQAGVGYRLNMGPT